MGRRGGGGGGGGGGVVIESGQRIFTSIVIKTYKVRRDWSEEGSGRGKSCGGFLCR